MFKTKVNNGVPEVSAEDVKPFINSITLIDVRKSEEYTGELSHIQSAKLVTLGPDLTEFLEKGDRKQQLLFICKSGGRSGQAALQALKLGYESIASLTGGMTHWNELKYPVVNILDK